MDDAPELDGRYWLAISLASVAGASLGDFCSHVIELGHLNGLPVFALFFAIALLARGTMRMGQDAMYWTAIVVLRAAATNLGDLATHDLKLPDTLFIAGLLAALALLVAAMRGTPAAARPRCDAPYWAAMLVAGTAGTALGDRCADIVGLLPSTLAWLAIWAASVGWALRRPGAGYPLPYWPVVLVVRTAGTNVADELAGREGLALGLPAVTGFGILALAALLLLWPRGTASVTP